MGSERKPVQVHCSAVTGQSAAFDVLMNGPMQEAQNRSADLPDVELEDFLRFCQFAYRGDYTPPHYIIDESTKGKDCDNPEEAGPNPIQSSSTLQTQSSNPPSDRSIDSFQDRNYNPSPHAFFETSYRRRLLKDTQSFEIFLWGTEGDSTFQEEDEGSEYSPESDDDWDVDSDSSKVSDNEVKCLITDSQSSLPKHVQLRKEYLAQNFLGYRIRDCLIIECSVIPNRKPEEDYTPVFLGHARLYVFAEKYGISTLRSLTLNRLHRTLVYFTLFKERIGDVVALARYAYDNTPDYESDIIDDLRRLVTQYIVCEFKTFASTEQFCSLLEEGGPFVRDWWRLVLKYQLS